MLILQLILYCCLFFLMVRLDAGNNALNCLYFYPEAYQEKVYALGLVDREEIKKMRVRFMIQFLIVMLAALLLIIGLWNKATDFLTAYLQSLLFLEVMNWFDGIVIDRLWVGHSKFWDIPGMNLPYVQTWSQILKKRGKLTVIWIGLAAVAAGLVVLIF